MDKVQDPVENIPNPPPVPAPPRPRRSILPWLLSGLVVLGGGAAACYWCFFRTTMPPNPQLTFKTPFLNVRPGVAYVGDTRCADCHPKIAAHFSKHPMGRSMAPVATILDAAKIDPLNHIPFVANDFRYDIVMRDNKVYHKETMLDARKNILYEKEMEVKYALGSGTHGRGFLVVENGRVWQSPISWYSEKSIWDLSPGYRFNNVHFNRPITAECLQCHANEVVPNKETENGYQLPLFRGLSESIGCERCHGPGELHVRLRATNPTAQQPDYSIVNPTHLEPTLREAVCQQCHLQGEQRVNRVGRNISEYRPGLPLHSFVSVFVTPPELLDARKAVGQVEQMAMSVCFTKSKGALGCISCHDPHQLPEPGEKIAYYRENCLKCHKTSQACTLPLSQRQIKDDSCVSCHMPAKSSSNISHASITDHRILKNPEREGTKKPSPQRPQNPKQPEIPIVLFHQDLPDPAKSTRDRDLAMAIGSKGFPGGLYMTRFARVSLENSLKEYPDDFEAREMLAKALWGLGKPEEAYQEILRLVREHPNERTLGSAAFFALQMNRLDDSLGFHRRLAELNPDNFDYQLTLADLLVQKEQWAPALAAAQAAVKANQARWEPRRLLILCYLELGKRDLARDAYETYLRFNPPDGDVLKRKFD
jgi:Tetratricopeptide repeat/Doubled CXXCH motif (Paired_CXXCH_1)/Cytochrome c554 and c-prime